MKRSVLFLLFLNLGLISNAQEIKVTFYKDSYLTKEVSEQKGNFKKVETNSADGNVNIKIFNLSKNCKIREENYKDNNPVGVWTTYSENCSIDKQRDFSKLVYSKMLVDTLFNNVISEGNSGNFEVARYGDNENEIFKYLASNLNYPAEAKDGGITGTVHLKFIIKADGSIKMFSILSKPNTFLDYESWQIIENMPNWIPAKKDGKPIDSYYVLPIKFNLK